MRASQIALFALACAVLGGCQLKKDASMQLCERNAQQLPRNAGDTQIERLGYIAACMKTVGFHMADTPRCRRLENWGDPGCYYRNRPWGAPGAGAPET